MKKFFWVLWRNYEILKTNISIEKGVLKSVEKTIKLSVPKNSICNYFFKFYLVNILFSFKIN